MELLDLEDCALIKTDKGAVEDLVLIAFYALHFRFGESDSYYNVLGSVLSFVGGRNLAVSLGTFPTAEKVASYPTILACRCGHVEDSHVTVYVEGCEHCQGSYTKIRALEMFPSGLNIKANVSKAWGTWAMAQGLRLIRQREQNNV
ncbi:hypothetical protein D3C78_872360 [compost metagenome]